MDKKKVKVVAVNCGIYNVDSITVKINDETIEICFDKAQNVLKYKEKEVFLTIKDNTYIIEEIKTNH